MALTSTNTTFVSSFSTVLNRVGNGILNILVRIAASSTMAHAAEARACQIRTLNAKSDAELAAMNLRRDHIAAYVFRDLMFA